MEEFFKNAWRDIKQRKNLELYLVLITAFIVIIVDTFGVDTSSAIIKVVLAVLALLAFGLIGDRHDSERLEKNINDLVKGGSATSFFNEWDDAPFRKRIIGAKEVSLIAIANHVFISRNSEPLKKFIIRGGKLRCILVDPSSNAMKMACDLGTGYEKQIDHLAMQVDLSVQQFKDFIGLSTDPSKVQIKLIDHLPFAILTMIDHQTDNGIMYITLNGFEEPPSIRPSFILNKIENEKWFQFYQKSYENIWESYKCNPVDLIGNRLPNQPNPGDS